MKRLLFSVLLILAFLSLPLFFRPTDSKKQPVPSQAQEPTLEIIKPISVDGFSLIDSDGKAVQLKGVTTDEFRKHNLYDSLDVLKQRLIQARSWGVNLVVLYLEQPYKVNARQKELVDLVNWSSSQGFYTLLYPVVHEYDKVSNPGGLASDDLHYSPLGDNLTQILTDLSLALKDNPFVLYGTGAEPHGVAVKDLFEKQSSLIEAVRKNNPNAILVVNGLNWGSDLDYYLKHPLPYANILYDHHTYISRIKGDVKYDYCKVSDKYNNKLPLFMGEFGGVYGEDFGSEEDLFCINGFLDSFSQYNINFAMHTIDSTSGLGLFNKNGHLTNKGQVFSRGLKIFSEKDLPKN